MIEKAFLQIESKTEQIINPNVFSAWRGFTEMGVDTHLFSWEQLKAGELSLSPTSIVVGGILTVRTALIQLGVSVPQNIDYPKSLWPFLQRSIVQTDLSAVRRLCVDDTFTPPIFIKPVNGHKDFAGQVLRKFRDLIPTSAFAPTTSVWQAEYVDFVSEYRFFVNRSKIIGVAHYRGDPMIFPDPFVVRQALLTYEQSKTAPISYTLDMGVTKGRNTLLIEVNDGHSFGAYGLPPAKHVKMLEDRWLQMVGSVSH